MRGCCALVGGHDRRREERLALRHPHDRGDRAPARKATIVVVELYRPGVTYAPSGLGRRVLLAADLL